MHPSSSEPQLFLSRIFAKTFLLVSPFLPLHPHSILKTATNMILLGYQWTHSTHLLKCCQWLTPSPSKWTMPTEWTAQWYCWAPMLSFPLLSAPVIWPPCYSWLHAIGILWPQGLGIQPEMLFPRHPNASSPSAGKFNHLKLHHWITHSPSSWPCSTFASAMHAYSFWAMGFNYYAC